MRGSWFRLGAALLYRAMLKSFTPHARLKSNGDTVDITDFTFNAPPEQIYHTLNCQLAVFSPEIDEAEPVTFEVGISKGGPTDWAMLLSDGRIKDRSDATRNQNKAPHDRTSFNIVSKMAALWRLTPRVPETLYDPARVDIVTELSQSRGDIVDSDGNAIEPIYTPVAAFDFNSLLNFIYTDRLGFASVVSNIPNYQLDRADFSLSQPYHSVAASQIGLFEPKYSSESEDALFIVDPQGELPTGFPNTVRACPPGSYMQFIVDKETLPETNAVLFSYSVSAATTDEEPTITTESDTQAVGTFGDDDYQRTVTTRFIKEWHDPNNFSRVTRSLVFKTEKRVSAKRDGLTREVSIETETDEFQYDGRLHKGYTRVLQLYIKLPGELTAGMRTIQTEVCQIAYSATSDPDELIKTGQVVTVNGGIVFEGDLFDPALESQFKQSLYEANNANAITDDLQVRFSTPISSRIEQHRETGTDQISITYQEIDHLNSNKPKRNGTIPHTGTLRVRVGTGDTQARQTMLLRDEASEAVDGTLPPVSVDAGDIPFEFALDRAEMILARHGLSPQRAAITFAGLDLALRRGSLRRVSNRAGQEFLVFITGYQITGSNLGARNFDYGQTAEGIVLQVL